ncbi:hypothetical protein [Kitasatospora sp. NPDC058190]|uniref:hypothetical protein n=1 Tax=Kitasatospora sp. NPDC058190 TaxID=3346371 RepID=UPI0036DD6E97
MPRAAGAYLAARTQAEVHGVAGERVTSQAQRAFTLAFTDPQVADDEIDLAEQLLTGLDLRATALTVRTAALVRDAGADGVDDRLEVLRTEARTAGIVAAQAALELAAAFHHAVRGDDAALAAVQPGCVISPAPATTPTTSTSPTPWLASTLRPLRASAGSTARRRCAPGGGPWSPAVRKVRSPASRPRFALASTRGHFGLRPNLHHFVDPLNRGEPRLDSAVHEPNNLDHVAAPGGQVLGACLAVDEQVVG